MKLNPELEASIETLIENIQTTDIYKSFEENKRVARRDMTLKNNINRTRSIRNQLDKMSTGEKNSDMAEGLIDEYDRLMDNTSVHKFSVAEHEFCELYQIIMSRIADKFDLEL